MPGSRPFWIAFASGAGFAVFSLFLLISILQLPNYHESIKIEESDSFHAPRKNVFVELTFHERTAVADFLYEHADGLNLTRGGAEFGSRNWIDKVEVLRPNKSDVISYHDDGGPLPERFARVSVAQTDDVNAYLVQYVVGPLPPSETTRIRPLIYPHNSGRHYVQTPLPDVMDLYVWVLGLGNDVVDITQDLLGARVNALDPFGQNSLGLGARPILIEDDKIVAWLEFFRTGPGSNGVSLLPQGLYVKLNMVTQNPDNWTTGEWFYNGVMYSGVESFREAWSSPNFTRLSRNLDGPWTDTEDFASKPYGRSQPPPLSIQPYGPRYQIDRKQQYISWMGFSFYLATSPSTALSLFDIRFNNDRIIYHLGLQEALAHYAGSEPVQSGLEFLDTLFGMGNSMFTLVPGYDCPAYADYLDITYHKGEHTYTNRNAICIFEYTSDALLQRHTSEWSVTVSRNTYLVVRSVSTVGNYDYTIDYLFYLDGSIEVKVRASGFIFAAFAGHPESPSEDQSPVSDSGTDELRSRNQYSSIPHPNSRYGYQIHPSASTSMHDHVLLFRCDLDISPHPSQNDTFHRISIVPHTETYPWDAPSLSTPCNTMHLHHHPSLSHESPLNWPPNSNEIYLIQSPTLNAWGEHRAYRIQPGTGIGTPSHLTILNSTSLNKSASWSAADLWILKNHDTEPAGAHELNYLAPHDPLIDFMKLANNESLASAEHGGEDLVVYFNLGGHHIPHSGDVPNTLMHTSASSMVLSPFNYFDGDVSVHSRQGVRVNARTRGDAEWVKGVRVVGGGRYEDYGGEGRRYEGYDDNGRKGGNEGRKKEVKLDIKRDLEPDVGGYFEEGEGEQRRVVGKRVGGGLWGLWPAGGREME